MGKKYIPNIGQTVKIITSKIKTNLGSKPKKRKYTRIEKFKTGKFKNSDLIYIIRGIEFLEIVGDTGLEAILRNLNSDNKELKPETVKLITLLRLGKGPLFDFLNMYENNMHLKFNAEREIANLENMYDIIQSSRDGIITKKKKIKDKDKNGKEKDVEIEISMSEEEIASIISEYESQLHYIQDNKFSTYLGLGMSLASMLGAICSESKKSKNIAKALGITGLISVGTLIGRKYVTKDYKEKVGDKMRDVRRLSGNLVENEPSSVIEEKDKLNEIKDNIHIAHGEEIKIENKVNLMKAIEIISMSILTGMIGVEKLKNAEKLDAKTISQILVEISQNSYLIRNIMDNVTFMYKFQHENQKLKEYEEEVEDIVRQIEEKQDPLIEIQKPFKSLEIKNLKGKFYQETNQDTGKVNFRHNIEIPEFSIRKGEVVLLSGKSGIGKSTFIRLLKRGDINNRNAILIDGEEVVDKLGKQFIAVKADKKLGIYSNVLEEITGKESISEVTIEEREKLEKVLKDVKLESEKILEDLSSKDYNQFSTGQKKRLALAQALYRTTENPSIILVDEPVGNVEDELIDEQLKSIIKAIKDVGAMGIVVTHRVDLAQRYVDKHYCIEDDGVMREKRAIEKEVEEK